MKNKIISTVLSAVFLSVVTTAGTAAARSVTNDFGITQQNEATMQWFMDAKSPSLVA
jgi:hypothetical protein